MSQDIAGAAEQDPVDGRTISGEHAGNDSAPIVSPDPSTRGVLERLDTPIAPGIVLLVAAVVVVSARLVFAAHGHIALFVQAGTGGADPTKVPHGLIVSKGAGYDGQFYYRLAIDPFNFAHTAYGITVDSARRYQRIGYPVLAWLSSFGDAALVPYTLVVVNVLALGFMGFVSGKWSQSFGRHALWGLLPAGCFGLVWSLSRDLTEITSIALLVAGIVAWRNGRYVLAGFAFGGSVLCRETALMAVIALVAVRVTEIARRRARFGRPDVAWLIPAVAYATWQLVVRLAQGSFPALAEGGNISAPFGGMIDGVRGWLVHPHRAELLQLLQFAVLLLVVVLAFVNFRRSQASSFEKLAFVLFVCLTITLSTSVWNNDPREFRTMVEPFVLGTGLLLGSRSFRPLPVACATWGVSALAVLLTLRSG